MIQQVNRKRKISNEIMAIMPNSGSDTDDVTTLDKENEVLSDSFYLNSVHIYQNTKVRDVVHCRLY